MSWSYITKWVGHTFYFYLNVSFTAFVENLRSRVLLVDSWPELRGPHPHVPWGAALPPRAPGWGRLLEGRQQRLLHAVRGRQLRPLFPPTHLIVYVSLSQELSFMAWYLSKNENSGYAQKVEKYVNFVAVENNKKKNSSVFFKQTYILYCSTNSMCILLDTITKGLHYACV